MAETTQAAFYYQGWAAFQDLLARTIARLEPDQLALRAAPQLRSVGENCRHIIGARARWGHLLMKLGDADFAALGEWDRKGQPERTPTELASALEQSWRVLQAALEGWTTEDLTFAYPNTDREPGEPEAFSRQWVIWHLVEHDIYHGGEISQILGMHGIVGLDL